VEFKALGATAAGSGEFEEATVLLEGCGRLGEEGATKEVRGRICWCGGEQNTVSVDGHGEEEEVSAGGMKTTRVSASISGLAELGAFDSAKIWALDQPIQGGEGRRPRCHHLRPLGEFLNQRPNIYIIRSRMHRRLIGEL
jgi:hypothetical protein